MNGLGAMAYYPATNTVTFGNYDQAWSQWNQAYYQTGATSQTVIWATWNLTYTANQITQVQPSQYVPTVEEVRAYKEAQKQQEDARAKARTLLLEHLDTEQRKSYTKDAHFEVVSQRNRRYRLSLTHGPRLVENDKPVTSYCIHTNGVPREDELLAHKLMLEGCEDEFLRTANATALAA